MILSSAVKLQKHDVILEVDGNKVGNDGTVVFRNLERISFDYLLSRKFGGDVVEVKILRNKEQIKLQVEANPLSHLVPIQQYDLLPRFFIYAGSTLAPSPRSFSSSRPYPHSPHSPSVSL